MHTEAVVHHKKDIFNIRIIFGRLYQQSDCTKDDLSIEARI